MPRSSLAVAVFALGVFAGSGALWAGGPGQRILVGPEIPVRQGETFPFVETMIAAHPSDAQRLSAGSMVLGDSEAGTRLFATADGGSTWWRAHLPGQPPQGGDPAVAFTPRGTAIYAELEVVKMPDGRSSSPVYVWRSEDGGRTWQEPAKLMDESYDHPWIAIAPDGRIYISVLWGADYQIGVFRSDDDGRTFTGPVQVADGHGQGANISTPLVLSDGTLVFTWFEFPLDEPKDGERYSAVYRTALSKDGGVTFAEPRLVVRTMEAERYGPHTTRLSGFTPFAVDRSASPWRDRMYLAWTDYRTGKARVHLTWSADRGQTWSEPRALGTSVPEHAHTYQPVIAVNKDGVLGVTWFDTRASQDGTAYDLYFAASLDGGATFLPEIRVSTETSQALGAGNLQPTPSVFRDRRGVSRLTFNTPASRYPQGGDYMGLVADAGGEFHPFWVDARTGTYQPWTSRIRVTNEPAVSATATAAGFERVDLGTRIEILFDPGTYDPATRELRIPVRLKNVSDRPIRGPIQVEVKGFGTGEKDRYGENAPEILGASNGKTGIGAVLDFSRPFGDFPALDPGAITSAVVWRFRLKGLAQNPSLHFVVYGEVEPSPPAR
jgi:hypothetical protein